MKIAPVADVKARLSAYLEMCAESPVVVTKNGRPAALLVAISDEEDLERLVLAHTPRFRAILDAEQRQIQEGRVLTHREFWRTVSERHRKAEAERRAKRLRTASKRAGRPSMRVNAEFAALEGDPAGTRHRPGRRDST